MKSLSYEQWVGLVRHGLTIVGTILVAKGTIDESNWTIITGSVLGMLSMIWSVRSKSV